MPLLFFNLFVCKDQEDETSSEAGSDTILKHITRKEDLDDDVVCCLIWTFLKSNLKNCWNKLFWISWSMRITYCICLRWFVQSCYFFYIRFCWRYHMVLWRSIKRLFEPRESSVLLVWFYCEVFMSLLFFNVFVCKGQRSWHFFRNRIRYHAPTHY